MAISVEDFILEYPVFDGKDQGVITRQLNKAMRQVDAKVWGKLYEDGVYALTAHLLFSKGILNGGDDGTPLRSLSGESADGLSESYEATGISGNDSIFMTSSYGQDYVRLKALTRCHVLVTK